MNFIKIKNLIKAYKNAYIYNDLINAKEKLLILNIQIERKKTELNQLQEIYLEKKKQIEMYDIQK